MGISRHADAGFRRFDNLEAGASIEEILDWFHVTREQVSAVLEFVACCLDAPAVPPSTPVADTLR
jgi:hypothetical protein